MIGSKWAGDQSFGDPSRLARLRLSLAVTVTTVLIMFAGYALLKNDPAAVRTAGIPSWFGVWLDRFHDFRTFVMVAGITLPSALLLHRRMDQGPRLVILLGSAVILTLMEFAQAWMPTRTCSGWDLMFTWAAVAFVELVSRGWRQIYVGPG